MNRFFGHDKKLAASLAGVIAFLLALVPFHAFLTVSLGSLFGHYTLWRLWEEYLLAILAAGSGWLILKDRAVAKRFVSSRIIWPIGAFVMIEVIWGLVAYSSHGVTAKALGYGWLVDLRFLLFFLAVWIVSTKFAGLRTGWPRLVFWPLAVVSIVAILQYLVLPYDFLKHFGYSSSTIFPYETINHSTHYIRAMSTLRGANPLGAYLVVTLSLVVAAVLGQRKSPWLWLLGLAGFLALFFSFSRSAWVGLAIAGLNLLAMQLRTAKAKKLAAVGALAVIAVTAGTAAALRSSPTFQNTIFHTSQNSTIKSTSDQQHESAFRSGLHDLAHEPLGRGPGTAGPASVYNQPHPARISENFFIQIGQETGWLGLAVFLAINILAARELWLRRDNALATGLLAGLIGASFVNMLSHAWADETLCYLWWGLAAVAISQKETDAKRS